MALTSAASTPDPLALPLTAVQYDAAYDNRARVPDFARYLNGWAEASLRVRQSDPCALDLAYGPAPSDRLDVFLPTTRQGKTRKAPVLVFLHGGYWRALDKSDHSFVAPTLVEQGVCVVVVNYALCPGTPEHPVRIPTITRQIVDALVWVHDHIGEFGGDPARVVVAGHSAGGHLAAMMLACQWDVVNPAMARRWLRHAVAISGVFDLAPLHLAPSFQASLCLDPVQIAQASPARLPSPIGTRLVALVGGDESDEFLRQNRLIQKVWGRGAVPVSQALPGLHHFSILQSIDQPRSPLVRHLLDALQRAG